MDWITANKIPIGNWAEALVDWLTIHARFFFDFMTNSLTELINLFLLILQYPNPLLFAIIVTALAYVIRRSIWFCLFVGLGLLLIINLGFWRETMQTLALVLTSAAICMGIGVPVGILAARKKWLYRLIEPLLDLMQTIPTFVYLIPALVLFGLGMVPGLVATTIFAMPAPIRLTYLGISSTPIQLIEAGQAFGATSWHRLFKIELPFALPYIRAGLTQAIMLSLSMVVIAALVGADGLGVPTLRALNQINIAKGFEVGIAIVIVAIVLDRFFRGKNNT